MGYITLCWKKSSVQHNISTIVDEVAGEPVVAGVWFRTRPVPWYRRYVGPGSIGELFFLLLANAYGYLRSGKRTEAEMLFDYSGPIYCAHTGDQVFFFGKQKDAVQPARVLRRFPITSMGSVAYQNHKITAVTFQFESSICFTLHFEGSPEELADFITSAKSAARVTESCG